MDGMDHDPSPAIRWYRSPVPREEMKACLERSDALAWAQTLGYAGLLAATGTATVLAAQAGWWGTAAGVFFLHGTVAAFLINAVHELGHGTVFRTRWLNRAWCAVFAFLGWINHRHFGESHGRHHRFTLHPPDDLEVVLPFHLGRREFLRDGFVKPRFLRDRARAAWRAVRGDLFRGPWDQACFPADDAEGRRRVVRWERGMLAGHAAIAGSAIAMGWWAVPLVVSLHGLCGGWLFWLCNNTQHIGLEDRVPDARRCCRTFTVNPVVRFLYWHMNFHIEHHMFAAVPCYRLARLHRAMRDDLPPTPHGLAAVWRDIAAALRRTPAASAAT
jgi:fatty acid desaturase